MQTTELILRTAAVTELVLISIILLKPSEKSDQSQGTLKNLVSQQHLYSSLLFFSIATYILAPSFVRSETLSSEWPLLTIPTLLFAEMIPAIFFLFCVRLVNDHFHLDPLLIALIIITLLLCLSGFCLSLNLEYLCSLQEKLNLNQLLALELKPEELAPKKLNSDELVSKHALLTSMLNSPLSLVLAQLARLFWVIAGFTLLIKDWSAELVEQRRKLRLYLVFGVGIYILIVMLVEQLLPDQLIANAEILNLCLILLLSSTGCFFLLQESEHSIFYNIHLTTSPSEGRHFKNSLALANTNSQAAEAQLSNLAQGVVSQMKEKRAFADEGLSIKELAKRLHTQEYLLRKTINGELKARNFNDFINQYRIEEIAERLALAEYQETPLLTLALDAGFRSLAPFNKTFKAHYNSTPSEYRKNLHN